MKKLFILLLSFIFIACSKQTSDPASYVSVKFAEEEEYVVMETVIGYWDSKSGVASLQATGYHFESFHLYLPNLTDTGNYKNASGDNIFFTKATDFIPSKLDDGFIHISFMDETFVKGTFNVLLEDSVHGAMKRMVTGEFGIYKQP